MRKIIVSEFVTLDGVMEARRRGGPPHTGWVFDFMSPQQERYKLDEALAAEALLLGGVTYEGFAAAWPDRSGEFADRMNTMPKHVASTTLRELDWNNSALLDGEVTARTVLELADPQAFNSGVVVHTYRPSAS